MGTPTFAVEPLRELVNAGFCIEAVVTTPDKPAGRGQKLACSPVKEFALEKGIKLFQPEKLKDTDFIDNLKAIYPDIIVVVAFRMLPREVWAIPRLGTFNLHASLLPQYRGAAPINWAIINGEARTGVTTFLIDHQIDTGSILLSEGVDITPLETAGELHDRLMAIGASLVVRTVQGLAAGKINAIPQENYSQKSSELRVAPKLYKENCRINWNATVKEVHNFVRGLSPYPAAWTIMKGGDGQEIVAKILSCKPCSSKSNRPVGSIVTDSKTFIHVACSDAMLSIESIQLAGKRAMPAKDFLQGFRGIEGYTFS